MTEECERLRTTTSNFPVADFATGATKQRVGYSGFSPARVLSIVAWLWHVAFTDGMPACY
jgi:hypothetical protein